MHCWCPPDVAQARFAERAALPGHHRAYVASLLSTELLAEFDEPMNVGHLLVVDTALPVDIDGLALNVSTAMRCSLD